jgi:hypothetical protein
VVADRPPTTRTVGADAKEHVDEGRSGTHADRLRTRTGAGQDPDGAPAMTALIRIALAVLFLDEFVVGFWN